MISRVVDIIVGLHIVRAGLEKLDRDISDKAALK
jgi:hypothetical protein